ncbi:MAG: hypothetical protein QOK20_561 [Acidimicrobiaceae bacterium]|nr:hypothetical protein [Acidimicrobiaceae bacterium]
MLVRQVVIPVSPSELWDALTEPEAIATWFGSQVEWDLRPGGRARFLTDEGTVRGGVVDDVRPGRHLSFRWWPEGEDQSAASQVSYDLEAEDDGTVLTVTEQPLATEATSASSATESTSESSATEATSSTEAPSATSVTSATEAPPATSGTEATSATEAPRATSTNEATSPTEAPPATSTNEATPATESPSASSATEAPPACVRTALAADPMGSWTGWDTRLFRCWAARIPVTAPALVGGRAVR